MPLAAPQIARAETALTGAELLLVDGGSVTPGGWSRR